MAIRLSCADSTFPKLSHDGSLAVISDLGFDAVDVCSFTGYRHTPPEDVLADPERGRGRRQRAARPLRASCRRRHVRDPRRLVRGARTQPPRPGGPRAVAEHFTRFVDVRRPHRRAGLTVLPGAGFEGVRRNASLELAAEQLNVRAALAGEAGLRLAFEPHYGSLAETPAAALDLIERTPDVGFALDYSHFVYQGIAQEEIDALLPRTHHFHVRQAAPGVVQARTREGTIDFVAHPRRAARAGLRRLLRARVPVGGRLARLLPRRLHRRDGGDARPAPDHDQRGMTTMKVAADRKALVTGGASGFGRAIARRLRDAGAAVAIVDVNAELAERTAAELGSGALGHPGRRALARPRSAPRSSGAVEAFGGLDTLVVSAGVFHMGELESVTEERWDRTLDVNLKGAFLVTQAAMPHLRASGRGRVVMISSDAGKRGFEALAPYTASKFGLNGLMESVAAEVATDNVTVNTLCPVGCPTTGMGQEVLAEKIARTGDSPEAIMARAAGRTRSAATCSSPTSPTRCCSSSPSTAASSPASRSTSTAARASARCREPTTERHVSGRSSVHCRDDEDHLVRRGRRDPSQP